MRPLPRVAVLGLAAAMAATWLARSHAAPPDLSGVARVNGRPAKDVVVWLERDAVARARPPAAVVVDQRNMQFAPRVVAVQVGTPVEMPNSDRVFHNVFSFRDGKVFDLGLYPAGRSKTVVFDRAGVSRLFCNIHPAMAAYVIAVDSPSFAVTDAQGRFAMADVPAGRYTYHAWRPGADRTTGSLSVQPGSPPVTLGVP